jgi:3-(3-hydroxy-phenyl)propionate hydroxylase
MTTHDIDILPLPASTYRWEFRLAAGEDQAGLTTPHALGQLLQPWTRHDDLDGLQVIRTATYTFRARLASRFQVGRVFLLGDAAHLTPPFIGQGLAAGLRDADNLAWKLAHVLTGQAGAGLLDTYQTERRPHAKALIHKAVRVGWAMTGGQDRAAAVRRIALAAAVRSDRICQAMGATATPWLKTGALQPAPRRLPGSGIPPALRPGGLIPNPLVSAGHGPPVRLDTILAGRTALLTTRRPDTALIHYGRRHGLALVQINSTPGTGTPAGPDPGQDATWTDVRLAGDAPPAGMQALVADPALTIIVRPDRVIAAAQPRCRLPQLPWHIPATALRGRPDTAPPPAQTDTAGPLPATR